MKRITFQIEQELLDKIDQRVASQEKILPGSPLNRSQVIRYLLFKALTGIEKERIGEDKNIS